jgi:aldehyde:ferredoxin oxidoreductase
MNISEMKNNHKRLTEFGYKLGQVERGYNNRSLHIDVTTNTIKEKVVTEEMKEKFVGGKGFGLKLLWDAVKDNTKWNDPENEIVVSGGPACGTTQYPGSGKSLVVSISPMTGIAIDSNVGGYFGPYLKFSGFDALEIQGKAEKDIIIFIDGNNGKVSIDEAPSEAIDAHVISEQMTEMYAKDDADKRNISVISAGTAAEHAHMGVLNFSFYDMRRQLPRIKQAGRGGIGTVFRNKKIKAVVIRFSDTKGDSNHPADFDKVARTGIKLHKEINRLDDNLMRMRQVGTANIIEVMDEYDLLPTHNFQYGSHKDATKIYSNVFRDNYLTQGLPDGCWFGCSLGCAKTADKFELLTGPYKGSLVTVDGPEYETAAGVGANMGIFDPQAVLELNFYCDTYGIDTISFGTSGAFAMECYERGIIDKEATGGLDLHFGNREAALELLHQMSKGEGFGIIVGKGVRWMKKYFVENYGADADFLQEIGMESKGLEYSQYLSKESLAQQGGYTFANKGPQHDEAWVIFMDMVNNQIPTFEDKAEALYYFPMFRTWFGLMGFCKLPWNDIFPENNKYQDEPAKVPEHVQNYIDVYNGVTGKTIDKDEMILQSERVYNFQKIFNLRLGGAKREGDIPPYRAMGPVTKEEYLSRQERYDGQLKEIQGLDPEKMTLEEKMAKTKEYRVAQYDKLTDTVYARKGWTNDGVPTVERLKEIGMDLPEVLEMAAKFQ